MYLYICYTMYRLLSAFVSICQDLLILKPLVCWVKTVLISGFVSDDVTQVYMYSVVYDV